MSPQGSVKFVDAKIKGWLVNGVIVLRPSPRKEGSREFKGCRLAAARSWRSRASRRALQAKGCCAGGEQRRSYSST